MHRQFRKLLEQAKGISEFVITINVDIRGFSTFSRNVESPESAIFIKKVFKEILDNYYEGASFYKSTGDGLLVLIPYTDDTVKQVVEKVISSSITLHNRFGTFCKDDPMINFAVPQRIGIGISRGTACKMISGETVLDYSGKVLNLASRLMDLARPNGIVFDSSLGIDLLNEQQRSNFEKKQVYIRGIAESRPIDVYYSSKVTQLPGYCLQPLVDVQWETEIHDIIFKKIKDFESFVFDLNSKPSDPSLINIEVRCPFAPNGRRRNDAVTSYNFQNFKYELKKGNPQIEVDFAALRELIQINKVKDNYKIEIEIAYVK